MMINKHTCKQTNKQTNKQTKKQTLELYAFAEDEPDLTKHGPEEAKGCLLLGDAIDEEFRRCHFHGRVDG